MTTTTTTTTGDASAAKATRPDDGAAGTEAFAKAAIERFKRSGDFDTIRRETLRGWTDSADGVAFRDKLRAIVEAEVARDAGLLTRDRGKAATLVGGAVERTQLYPEARLAAAKHIFQTQDFRDRIYALLKESAAKEDAKAGDGDTGTSARDAAMAFIEREQGA